MSIRRKRKWERNNDEKKKRIQYQIPKNVLEKEPKDRRTEML